MADVQAAMERLCVKFKDTVCEKYAAEAEQYAKDNAPWTDKTGDARKLLKGYVIDEEGVLGFGIAHRKEYGKYLETANSGKNAILKPTVEHLRQRFFEAAKSAFGG